MGTTDWLPPPIWRGRDCPCWCSSASTTSAAPLRRSTRSRPRRPAVPLLRPRLAAARAARLRPRARPRSSGHRVYTPTCATAAPDASTPRRGDRASFRAHGGATSRRLAGFYAESGSWRRRCWSRCRPSGRSAARRPRSSGTTWSARPLGAALERRFTDDGRPRTGSHRRADRDVRVAPRPVARAEPLLPLPPARPWARRLAAPGRRPGRLAEALARAAADAGAEIVTAAGASAIRGDDDGAEVTWHRHGETHTVRSRHVLGDVAPWVQRILMGDSEDAETKPEGSQLVLNLLLDRLPQLRSGVDPRVAFAGTLSRRRRTRPARGGVRRRGRRPAPVDHPGPARLPVPRRSRECSATPPTACTP